MNKKTVQTRSVNRVLHRKRDSYMIKADAYGHGAVRCAQALEAEANGAKAARQAEVQGSEASALTASGDSPLPDAPTKSGWSTTKIIPVERLKTLDLNADAGALHRQAYRP